jgi:hypothetical protein
MALTSAQQATLKAAILADPNLNTGFPTNSDGASAIASLLNALASPTFLVWRTEAPVSDVLDAIDFTKYTPTDAPDNTTTYLNRSINVQIKQINLQLLLQGRDRINASKANVRAALRDATIQLPTGAAGAAVTAGGANAVTVLTACTRSATLGEKYLAGGTATTGGVTANLLGFEGALSYPDVMGAMGW